MINTNFFILKELIFGQAKLQKNAIKIKTNKLLVFCWTLEFIFCTFACSQKQKTKSEEAMTPIRMSVFLSILLLMQSCYQAKESYEHELGVISNPRMYQKLAEDFPEKKLVNLQGYIPDIVLDIRYATKNNFTGRIIYPEPKAFIRLPVAKAIKNIQQDLYKKGLGLKIFDAYRPYSATVKFYEVYPDTNFVAAPWNGSRHNRGCAVDVTLIDLSTGEELEMPTTFDDFTAKAGHNYTDLPDTIIKNRKLLKETMENHGFSSYEHEWWHYDFNGWENYKLLNIPFTDLD